MHAVNLNIIIDLGDVTQLARFFGVGYDIVSLYQSSSY